MRPNYNRTYPLDLILRAHGTAELVNAHDETLWASDADEDFKEEIPEEFLTEDDLDDILDFLLDFEVIDQEEFDKFDSEEWDMTVETLDQDEPLEETEEE